MNRRDRRAAAARGKAAAVSMPADVAVLLAEATHAYQQGQGAQAEVICRQILALDPAHAGALNILGILYQASGNHRLAVKALAKAVAVNGLDPACQYNLAFSYQALGERAAAAVHFRNAIALGLSGKGVEQFLMKSEVVAQFAMRIAEREKSLTASEPLFTPARIATIADDVFLRCALEATVVGGVTLELFLTELRRALLSVADADARAPAGANDDVVALSSALARQCFLNEYVFAETDEEVRQASGLRDLLVQNAAAAGRISPLLLAAVAAYFPLHTLPAAKLLLERTWPPATAELVRVLVREPLEEAEDRRAIPALTAIDDGTSTAVMEQYEENPYPRWTINPFAALASEAPGASADANPARGGERILIAGCGTGEHSVGVAQRAPQARILAIDLSRASLAYARRKTREAGLRNVEYMQADVLELEGLGRSFDRIETVGVLHHLADPLKGWRVLLSLLAPNAIMRVGLYSEAARRAVVEARALVAARGYRATPADIRALRQEILHARNEARWQTLLATVDFYSISGCRDMLFNVMEHRFSIPEIAAFLNAHGLTFLGFELDGKTIERFAREYPGPAALTDLGAWAAFEAANPQTFRNMYLFSIRRNEAVGA